jgi:flagellar hook-basal body complex protein FliE
MPPRESFFFFFASCLPSSLTNLVSQDRKLPRRVEKSKKKNQRTAKKNQPEAASILHPRICKVNRLLAAAAAAAAAAQLGPRRAGSV